MKRLLGYTIFCLLLLLPSFGIQQLSAREENGKYQITVENGGTFQLFEDSTEDIKFGVTPIIQPYTIVAATSTGSATTTRMFGSLSPQVSNLYDLGESGLAWRNLYASGSVIGISVTECASGSVTAPCYTFTSDSGKNTGIYLQGEDIMAATASGTRVFTWTPTSTNSHVTSTAPRYLATRAGSTSEPALGFTSGSAAYGMWFTHDPTDQAFYLVASSTDMMGLSNIGGETFMSIYATSVLPGADNDTDIGSAAFSFNDGHFDGTMNAKIVRNTYQTCIGTQSCADSSVALQIATTTGSALILLTQDASGHTSSDGGFMTYNGGLVLGTKEATNVVFQTAGVGRWNIIGGATGFGGVTGDMIPSTNNVYDFGSQTTAIKNVYASGTVLALGGLKLGYASNTSDTDPTINQPCGTVRIPNSSSTIAVVNNKATVNSIINLTFQQWGSGGGSYLPRVTKAAGSFVLTMSGGNTQDAVIDFCIINPSNL